MTLRVDRKWRETADIACFEFVDPAGGPLPPFAAGAHIDVEVGPGLVRQYSLCNAPGQRDRYQIGVLREPVSRGGSIQLVDRVGEGDLIRVSDPRNHFRLDPDGTYSVLIAGGIGITPILCMAEHLAHIGAPFQMHYGLRSPDRAAFRSRIECSAFASAVAFHFDDGASDQRLDLTQIVAAAPPSAHLYVCGPAGLIEAVLAAARASGWSEERLHREFFTPPEIATGIGSDLAFEVQIASSGVVLSVPAETSITAVLAEHGIEVPTSCERGVCGSCITRVLSGVPNHRDFFLTPDEQAANDQMALCCSRSGSRRLVLAL
jgi:vanillate O-demethylase ferredoxin subunit